MPENIMALVYKGNNVAYIHVTHIADGRFCEQRHSSYKQWCLYPIQTNNISFPAIKKHKLLAHYPHKMPLAKKKSYDGINHL